MKIVKRLLVLGLGCTVRAYDLLLSVSLNMYLAHKEAWEQWAERCRERSPVLWSHRWRNQHSENTLPCCTNLVRIKLSFGRKNLKMLIILRARKSVGYVGDEH